MRFRHIVFITLISLWILSGCAADYYGNKNYQLSGRVTDTFGEPIQGANISIAGSGINSHPSATNSNGEFKVLYSTSFKNLHAGLIVEKQGYVGQAAEFTIGQDSQINIWLTIK